MDGGPEIAVVVPSHDRPLRLPRPRFRALLDIPGPAVIHAAEIASLAWGSIRHRSLFL